MVKSVKHSKLPIHNWIFQQMTDAILFVDRDGLIIAANDAAVELLQINDLNSKVYYEDYLDLQVLSKPNSKEILIRTRNKPEKLILMRSKQINDYVCVMLREGGLKVAQESIRSSLNQLLDGPYEGIIMHDNGKIVDCDLAFSSMTGYDRSELIGRTILSLIHPKDKRIILRTLFDKENTTYTVRGMRKDGQMIYVEFVTDVVKHRNGEFTIAVVRNVTERIENEKQIEFMAYYDELTDIPNRNYFVKTLKNEIKNTKNKFAVHFVDLDHFKHINDTFGYHFGDQLLKACADRLKNLLIENVFIARMTGDEFLILQRNIKDEEEATQFAEKLIEMFKSPINVDGYEIYTSLSIGISIYPDYGKEPDDLIKQADSAMYVIKKDNRNNYKVYRPSFTEGFRERLELENELHRAIKDKDFELYFQPQIDIKTNKIIGLEALCRWNHPVRGIISPGEFIPIAEKTGLIVELGDWVLREACRQNKEWQDMGLPKVKVSVNLSAKQVIQRDLISQVKEILNETSLEPKYLELEITESVAMTNEKYIFETLKDIQQLGVNIALDDFGTGYSSLRYISQFPLSKLKIDRVFIQNRTAQNEAIVKTIIHLSHSLNLRVSAEGVEREEDLLFLHQQNCDEVQGFYFSKPVPKSEVKKLFEAFA